VVGASRGAVMATRASSAPCWPPEEREDSATVIFPDHSSFFAALADRVVTLLGASSWNSGTSWARSGVIGGEVRINDSRHFARSRGAFLPAFGLIHVPMSSPLGVA
jgi:hypothetical protein